MIVVPQVAFHGQAVAMGEELPPVRIVRELVALGATEVALLDLDGVVAGDVLPGWVEAIVAVAGVPLRFDGRLHDGDRIERLARAGFRTVVVDQSAVFEPMLLRWAMDLYGPRLCVELQVDGEYVFDAPPAAFGRELEEVVLDLHFRGVRRLLYRDVTSRELPLQRLLDLCDRAPGMRMTYAGALHDVEAVSELAMVGPVLEAGLVRSDLVLDGALDLVAANRAASGA
ncbi:MAG: 1-(5-phosphoribosyl)-5-[(5-phosphoribosylamino)methylideneamino] imidazole-4-carboxamide isomerase [Thermoleophilia bacterium]|nr:1-(5-phosphoribosyl)-5-[(5-phosphoribosylamino)methylideneamino] imidazole-4-carboxamide isomerase [Thermoleophilia bacterium]